MSANAHADDGIAAVHVKVAVALGGGTSNSGGGSGSGSIAQTAQQPPSDAPKSARQLEIERLKASLTTRTSPAPRVSPGGTGSGVVAGAAGATAVSSTAPVTAGREEETLSPPSLPTASGARIGSAAQSVAPVPGTTSITRQQERHAAGRGEEDEKRGPGSGSVGGPARGPGGAVAGASHDGGNGSDSEGSRAGDTDDIDLDSADDEEEHDGAGGDDRREGSGGWDAGRRRLSSDAGSEDDGGGGRAGSGLLNAADTAYVLDGWEHACVGGNARERRG